MRGHWQLFKLVWGAFLEWQYRREVTATETVVVLTAYFVSELFYVLGVL